MTCIRVRSASERRTENGDIEIMEQSRFATSLAFCPRWREREWTLNALRFKVADIAQGRGIASAETELARRLTLDGWSLPPDVAFGATLIFEPA